MCFSQVLEDYIFVRICFIPQPTSHDCENLKFIIHEFFISQPAPCKLRNVSCVNHFQSIMCHPTTQKSWDEYCWNNLIDLLLLCDPATSNLQIVGCGLQKRTNKILVLFLSHNLQPAKCGMQIVGWLIKFES